SPTWRPWSNRSCSTLSGCSSSASGSCTSHQSFLWHWRPEVKRDLESRYGPASRGWWFGTVVKVAGPPRRKLGRERGMDERFRGMDGSFRTRNMPEGCDSERVTDRPPDF